MTTEILNAQGRSDENAIAQLEQDLNITIPIEYRAFLLEYGGGKTDPDAFDFLDGDEGSLVDQLYYIDSKFDKYGNLRNIRDVFRDVSPANLLMIGRDPGGNQICVFLEGERRGKIALWNHEFGSVTSEQDIVKSTKIIANNFDEFLENLFEFDL